MQRRTRDGYGQQAGGRVRSAAHAAVAVVAGLQRGGGPAERGDRMAAAGVAEQGVESDPGGQARG
jgi:hypothetical protein